MRKHPETSQCVSPGRSIRTRSLSGWQRSILRASHLTEQISAGAVDRLKFAEALPEELARGVVERRMRADAAVQAVADRAIRVVSTAG